MAPAAAAERAAATRAAAATGGGGGADRGRRWWLARAAAALGFGVCWGGLGRYIKGAGKGSLGRIRPEVGSL